MKTLFDPCPSGWRVPRSGIDAEGPWQSLTTEKGELLHTDTPEMGRSFSPEVSFPSAAWYGTPGNRYADTGNFFAASRTGYQWSSTVTGTLAYHWHCGVSISFNLRNVRTFGFSVRCIRE